MSPLAILPLLLASLQAPAIQGPGPVPYEAGLRLSWAAYIQGEPDYESILLVSSVEGDDALFRIAWNRGADRQWKAVERHLSRRERQLGRSFYQYAEEKGANEFRGYAFAMTTQSVLKDLKEKGSAEVAFLLPEVARTPHRGTLARVGDGPEPFTILLDGEGVTLPAIRASGKLTNPTTSWEEVTTEFLFLDDPQAAWALESRVQYRGGEGGKRLVRIATHAATDLLEEELREECRASVYDLYFATGSAELDDASTPTLQRIAEILTSNPEWQLSLEGHTDSIGSPESNLELSQRRADQVRQALEAKYGILAGRLSAEGRGETQPIDDNGTPEGRARNRRVELVRACEPTNSPRRGS